MLSYIDILDAKMRHEEMIKRAAHERLASSGQLGAKRGWTELFRAAVRAVTERLFVRVGDRR